jgi:hypothetical protein
MFKEKKGPPSESDGGVSGNRTISKETSVKRTTCVILNYGQRKKIPFSIAAPTDFIFEHLCDEKYFYTICVYFSL